VLGLDAVPYREVAAAADPARGEAALFRGLAGPFPLVSTFPSTTNVALSGFLEPFGVPPSPGYEVRYFDWQENRVRGGGPFSYHRLLFPWRKFFDSSEESLWAGMVGELRPVRTSIREIDEAFDAFLASDKPVYFAWVSGTDGVGHLQGPDALGPALAALDAALRRARSRHPTRPFAVVFFSDHGMAGDGHRLANVRHDARQRLRRAGFHLGHRLRQPRDAVIAELGMISSFVVFTRPGEAPEASRELAAVPGVELCVHRQGDGFEVDGPEGAAAIGRRPAGEGEEWSYRPAGGDPLAYREVVAALRRRAGDPGRDWFSDRWWLEATAGRTFPDALYRLARSFDLVANGASVVCSTDVDHLYGARGAAMAARFSVGRLRWTHGSLERQATLGFVLTDLPGYPPGGSEPASAAAAGPEPDHPVRFDQVFVPVARWLAARRPEGRSHDPLTHHRR
jgi:Type I phosphodiesterase / nucleotide pyrophosphatase